MGTKNLAPLIAHPLPAAPHFVEREAEVRAMRDFWSGDARVLSLVGVGGAGKTALTQRFLSELLETDAPDGLLVWSFYDDPDTNAFLQTAFRYFTGGEVAEAKGTGWFHLLKEALAGESRFLIVLDGLERVQRPHTDASGIYGDIEDPLLSGLLVRLAVGEGKSKALLTSRFPISDVERAAKERHIVLDINQLDMATALGLVRSHGVQGTDEEVASLIRSFGRHALTVDLLGGAVARFFGNQPSRVEMPQGGPQDEQAERLGTVLSFYATHLDQHQKDLLSRLCVFRFGVSAASLYDVFLESEKGSIAGSLSGVSHERIVELLAELVDAHLIYREGSDRYTVHPAVRDYFYRLFRDAANVHGAITRHLMSLTNRPGIGLPVDKEALDLLEELIFHALHSGSEREALEIYVSRMGGSQHLNVNLGEYARTYRILRAFPECPDPGGMYQCLRAFGRFEEALEWRPQNRYIGLANGKLRQLRDDASESTRRIAQFLRGEDTRLPERAPDVPLPPAYLLLMAGRPEDAERTAMQELRISLFRDDVVRNELALVESARQRGRRAEASKRLEEVSKWILSSASHEHLCMMLLFRARLALDEDQVERAIVSLEEAIQVSRDSNFSLIESDLLVEKARAFARMGKKAEAVEIARQAVELASSVEIGFIWGEMAGHKLLAEIDDSSEGSIRAESIRRILEIQERINEQVR